MNEKSVIKKGFTYIGGRALRYKVCESEGFTRYSITDGRVLVSGKPTNKIVDVFNLLDQTGEWVTDGKRHDKQDFPDTEDIIKTMRERCTVSVEKTPFIYSSNTDYRIFKQKGGNLIMIKEAKIFHDSIFYQVHPPLTWREAVKEMKNGERITKLNWNEEDYLYLNNGVLVDDTDADHLSLLDTGGIWILKLRD